MNARRAARAIDPDRIRDEDVKALFDRVGIRRDSDDVHILASQCAMCGSLFKGE